MWLMCVFCLFSTFLLSIPVFSYVGSVDFPSKLSSFLIHFFSFSHFSSLCLSPFPLVVFVALLGWFYVNVT